MPEMPARFCRRCDYDLAATASPVCPECGRAFRPDDPRTFRRWPRRSWRGRLRRFRWLLVGAVLLVLGWPRGWSLTRITWVDPAGASVVSGSALTIGRPWWLGGWHRPIVWGNSDGAPSMPSQGPGTFVMFTDDLWQCPSPWPWRGEHAGQGRLSLYGPSMLLKLAPAQWRADIEGYVRQVARDSGHASAVEGSMSINASITPWDKRLPADLRTGPR